MRSRKLGKWQQQIMDALDRGVKLVERVGSNDTVRGRRAWRRILLIEGSKETEVRRGTVDGLLSSRRLVRQGERPEMNCFDPSTREVEIRRAP